MKLSMVVATHKFYQMPLDAAYLPVQAGAEGKPSLGYMGDNTGDNISLKNPDYCELTALYWAWKNLDADAIGLCHYRRHFLSPNRKTGDKWSRVLSGAEIENYLKDYDAVLPRKRRYFIETNEQQYCHAHPPEDWEALCRLVRERHPECQEALERMRHARSGHMFNIFILRRELLESYCAWLFPLLFELEAQGFGKSGRIFGHLSERFFDVWLYSHQVNFVEAPAAFMERQNWLVKGGAFVWRKFFG
jgi:hypothetical protein